MATSPPPPPAPQPPLREREYNDSPPTTKYLNSIDLYNVTAQRRDSKTSNASSTKNDYYYDKENELYSTRKSERNSKLAPPREDREDLYEEQMQQQRQQYQQQQQQYQTRTNTTQRGSTSYNSRLSPILSSPTHDVTNYTFTF